jgi:non-ribosomal peptide synthetase component F
MTSLSAFQSPDATSPNSKTWSDSSSTCSQCALIFPEDPTFRELLARVREAALGAYEHQDLPFEKLVEVIQPERDISYAPLFQVMFHLGNMSAPAFDLPGLKLTPLVADTGTSKFDLTLDLVESSSRAQGDVRLQHRPLR